MPHTRQGTYFSSGGIEQHQGDDDGSDEDDDMHQQHQHAHPYVAFVTAMSNAALGYVGAPSIIPSQQPTNTTATAQQGSAWSPFLRGSVRNKTSALIPHHQYHRGDSLREYITQALTRPDYTDQYWKAFEVGYDAAEEDEDTTDVHHRKPVPKEVLPSIFAYAGCMKMFRVFTRKRLNVSLCRRLIAQ